MQKRVQLGVGIAVVTYGVLLLISNLLGIRLWAYLWPVLLIALGVWILLRPRLASNRGTLVRLLGEVRRRDSWVVRSQEIWSIISDVDLDFTRASVPEGETVLRFKGFVGDIDLTAPPDVGVAVRSTAFLTSARAFGHKQDSFGMTYETESIRYREATRRVRVELLHFVADVTIRATATDS